MGVRIFWVAAHTRRAPAALRAGRPSNSVVAVISVIWITEPTPHPSRILALGTPGRIHSSGDAMSEMSDLSYAIAFALLGLSWLVLRSAGTKENEQPRRCRSSAMIQRDD